MEDIELQEYIESIRWRTAKDGSHAYTMVGWAPEKEKQFRELVRVIHAKGVKEKFWKTEYTYYQIGDFVYWNMNYSPEETTLINRKTIREPDYSEPNYM